MHSTAATVLRLIASLSATKHDSLLVESSYKVVGSPAEGPQRHCSFGASLKAVVAFLLNLEGSVWRFERVINGNVEPICRER